MMANNTAMAVASGISGMDKAEYILVVSTKNLALKPRSAGMPKFDMHPTNASNALAVIAGVINGRVTCMRVRRGLAPDILAASSRLVSIRPRAPLTVMNTTGNW